MDDGFLWSDAETRAKARSGTTIGIQSIKDRRLSLSLTSCPGLTVGACVPFYFCPRSVMLYVLFKRNYPGLTYMGGQEPIVHLVADFYETVEWANSKNLRWAFTLTNAASNYFEDRSGLHYLDQVNWDAVKKDDWRDREVKEAKLAEFLVENCFPWCLLIGIGVHNEAVARCVSQMISGQDHAPQVKILKQWYY